MKDTKKNPETTLKKNAESSLANSQEIFGLLVDAVEDYAIFALDPNGIILTWNLGAQRLKGYKPKDVIGTSFTQFYTPVDIERNHPQNELKIATEKGKYEEEGWRVKKDGSHFWANVVITALKDSTGTLRGFAKVTRDLTERKKAEDALKISEERFRLMIEVVQDYAIFMLDPKGHVATWNKGAERNKGYLSHEIIGQHFSTFYPREDREAGKPEQELAEAITKGRFEDEGLRVRKDGTTFWANVVITAIYDKKNNLLGFSKVTRDLTERKKSEDELRAAYMGLEKRVEERTLELSKEKMNAERAVKVRDQFFSMASHELKTPLSSMKLQVQMRKRSVLRGDLSDFAPERLLDLCNDDNRQVERLTFLVDNMLDISRLTSGNFDLRIETVELNELITDTLKRMIPALHESNNSCHFVPAMKVQGHWDRHRLEQVLINLLSNAGKYAPNKPIDISISVDANWASITVKDQGPGMSLELQRKVFNPFERGVKSNDVAGLGLGLYIVKQIIDAHQGRIKVESELGKGTSFIIQLPLNHTENR